MKEVKTDKEADLQKAAEKALKALGVVYLHLPNRARAWAGWPDLVFCLRGVPHAVELKTATGKLKPDQVSTLTAMRANGWRTYLCRSLDFFVDIINGRAHEWHPDETQTKD